MAEKKTAPRGALRVTVYDGEGKALSVRPVDARELIASGAYTGEIPRPDKVEKPEVAAQDKTGGEAGAAKADKSSGSKAEPSKTGGKAGAAK